MKAKNILFTLLASAGVVSAAENLVLNGDFESTGGWANWDKTASITQTDRHGGNSSYRLASKTKLTQAFSSKILVKAEKLEFSFWYKGTAPLVHLRFYNMEQKRIQNALGKDLSFCAAPKTQKEWTFEKKTVVLPKNIQMKNIFVEIQIQRWNPGELFIDDIVLRAIGPEKKDAKTETNTNLVVNGGFELDKDHFWRLGSIKTVSDVKHSGKKSLYIKGTKLAQFFSNEVLVRGDSFVFTQYTKGSKLVFRLFLKDLSGKSVLNKQGKPFIYYKELPGGKDWTKHQDVIVLPESVRGKPVLYYLQYQLWGKGEVWLDDVSMEGNLPADLPKPDPKGTAVKDFPRIIFYSEKQEKLPPIKFPYQYGSANGMLLKNGIPHFYAGNASFGGGQFTPEALWLTPFYNYSMVSLDWGLHLHPQAAGNYLLVRYPDTVPSLSLWRELNRIGIVVEHDTGNAAPVYNPVRRLSGQFPEVNRFITTPSHFYSYDHNTEIGREFHRRAWQARYFHLKGSPVMATEVYNELGYTPDHPRFLKFFRDFTKKKYGDLATANKVWHTDFKTWDDVVPAHLLDGGIPGSSGAFAIRRVLQKKYWQLNYDYLRASQLDLIPGLIKMKEDLAKITDTPMLVDWRGHSGRDSDGYAASDPDLLEDVVGVFALHTSMPYVDFKGESADENTVLDVLTHNVMHHEFVSSNTKHPYINPEAIQRSKTTPGTSAVSMKKNSFKDFSQPWQFTLEAERQTGIDKGYWKADFNDQTWSKLPVPSCWDESEEFKGRTGYGWYRTTFTVPARLKNDWEDGSRRFCIYGKGVAQRGTIWVNGVKVGEPVGWDSVYQYDISNVLKYGEKNQITFLVEGPKGNYANGLRFFVYVLPEDKIAQNELYDEKAYMSIFWTAMTHGCSSIMLWHWDSTWLPFMAKVNTSLENGEALLMPAARHRKSKVAMLLPFLGKKGLPTPLSKDNRSYMKWYSGVLFNQVYPALLTEKNMSAITPEKYPLAFYPYSNLVFADTYRSFEKYVKDGGTAVVTFNSMDMTFDRFSDSGLFAFLGIRKTGEYNGKKSFTMSGKTYPVSDGDTEKISGIRFSGNGRILASFADGSPAVMEIRKGKGRVIFAGVNMGIEAVHDLSGKLLKEAGIRPAMEFTEKGTKEEFPYLEGFFGGTEKRFALYLHNWGGKARKVTVKLPYAGKYDVRNAIEVDGKTMKADGKFSFTVSGSSPVCFLFEKPGTPKMTLKTVSAAKKALIAKIGTLEKNPKDLNSKAPKVLYIDYEYVHMKTLFPHLSLAVRAAGGEVWSFNAKEITPELLKKFDTVILNEACALAGRSQKFRNFEKVLPEYVKNGGKVLLLSSQLPTASNSTPILMWAFSRMFGISDGPCIKDASSCAYDDPYQVSFTQFGTHPVAKGVKKVQFFVSRKIRTNKRRITADPIVLHKGEPVASAWKFGRGEVLYFTDLMWLQPTRIHDCDNAVMLRNLASYLIGKDGAENPYKPFANAE